MRQPLRRNPARQAVAIGESIPPPVGGLNARDELADMDPRDALILDNYFPSTNTVDLRRGNIEHATGIGGNVESLLPWEGASTRKLFAAKATGIYDVTVPGTVGAAVQSSLTNGRWQHINFRNTGNSYLYAVNGEDKPLLYDGTNWVAVDGSSTPAITGVTTTKLIHITAHKKRIWFVERDSTKAWYLGVDAVGGAATAFDFGGEFKKGGHLVAIDTWTRDGGSGPDDLLVAISSMGEVAIYAGTDPGSDWALVGTFLIGAPIGRRCFIKAGADLGVITIDGVLPLSSVLGVDRAAAQRVAITDKINKLFNDAARTYAANFGWQGLSYPRGNMAIINVPVGSTTAHQYVMNTLTGAWCRFTNLNAFCWALFNNDLYFGGSGAVYKADTGFSDNGANIDGDLKTAFHYFRRRGMRKRFTMLRTLLASSGRPMPAIELNVDYEDRVPSSVPVASLGSTDVWDTGLWDSAVWTGTAEITGTWGGVAGEGYCAAVRMRSASKGISIQVNAFDIVFEPAQGAFT